MAERSKLCPLTNQQARHPKRCPPSEGRPIASSSLVLPRCLVARPWPGWGSLLPPAPQRCPCRRACPAPGRVRASAPRKQSSCTVSARSWESLRWGLCCSPCCRDPGTGGSVLLLSPLFLQRGLGRAHKRSSWVNCSSRAPFSICTALAPEGVALRQPAPD